MPRPSSEKRSGPSTSAERLARPGGPRSMNMTSGRKRKSRAFTRKCTEERHTGEARRLPRADRSAPATPTRARRGARESRARAGHRRGRARGGETQASRRPPAGRQVRGVSGGTRGGARTRGRAQGGGRGGGHCPAPLLKHLKRVRNVRVQGTKSGCFSKEFESHEHRRIPSRCRQAERHHGGRREVRPGQGAQQPRPQPGHHVAATQILAEPVARRGDGRGAQPVSAGDRGPPLGLRRWRREPRSGASRGRCAGAKTVVFPANQGGA